MISLSGARIDIFAAGALSNKTGYRCSHAGTAYHIYRYTQLLQCLLNTKMGETPSATTTKHKTYRVSRENPCQTGEISLMATPEVKYRPGDSATQPAGSTPGAIQTLRMQQHQAPSLSVVKCSNPLSEFGDDR